MPTPRKLQEEAELRTLRPGATPSALSAGRLRYEEPCEIRTCFQRDIDRIVHSKSFRRLKHKTQVFLQPEGDHYRTRMTHTIEVVRISRTIARALGMNEDLAEAVAWGHDLGHTPFGHAGERALAAICPEGFLHNEQSLRVVDKLEKNGAGLNLSAEVRDGILNHVGEGSPATPEGKIVRLSDLVAYINHDVDDAVRAGIMSENDIPAYIADATGRRYGKRLDTVVKDIISASADGEIKMSPAMDKVMHEYREFMFAAVYRNPIAKSEESKVLGILEKLYSHYLRNIEKMPADYVRLLDTDSPERVVSDYIAGMTDKYAIYKFSELFIPEAWQVR